jgi:serine/threonine protein kinase
MTWKATITSGALKGTEFVICDEKPLIVGRGSSSDTKITDPKLSRVHCTLKLSKGNLFLTDSGSASGTFLHGKRVDTCQLHSGDEILVGDTRLNVMNTAGLDEKTMQGSRQKPAINRRSISLDSLAGQTINRFLVERLVSKGRNGVVFKGVDQADGKPVAIKVLNPQNAVDERQQERFIRAMRTMLPVRHPHMIRLYRAGKQSGLCWAAMEWIDGTSLKELIDLIGIHGTLDWKDLWRIAVHMGRALCEAEKLRIVHRNVTPTNILRRNSDKSYLLTDLMFAKALEETDAAMLTRPGDVLGELKYLSPERLMNPELADCRSDQYSLGVTLYVLATGHSPYPATDVAALLQQVSHSRPTPPADIAIGFDERFSDLVMRLLSKDPECRYDTSAELLKDLSRVGKFGGLDADWSEWI